MAWPEDSVQSLVSPWWVAVDRARPSRGHLLWAWVPHFASTPYVLIPEGRGSPLEHKRVSLRIEALPITFHPQRIDPPVAALPLDGGEVFTVLRATKRPVLVLNTPARARTDVGLARSPHPPKFIVAPYHSAARNEAGEGTSEAMLARIRRCEYPEILWDKLPIVGEESSVLRLDGLLPLADHHEAFDHTGYGLSPQALVVLDQWTQWFMSGQLPSDCELSQVRELLMSL
ncbi:MAG: hypothetical protein Q8Q09_26200 [Deltaproteobacteria bacterium]|nr:hypothetical protein [Deltaproteobacteria bacterium]